MLSHSLAPSTKASAFILKPVLISACKRFLSAGGEYPAVFRNSQGRNMKSTKLSCLAQGIRVELCARFTFQRVLEASRRIGHCVGRVAALTHWAVSVLLLFGAAVSQAEPAQPASVSDARSIDGASAARV